MFPNARTGGRGLGLPSPKFRSGQLPSTAIPLVTSFSIDADASNSASENDNMSTDSDDYDVYPGRRYSLDSSPQDPRVLPKSGGAGRYGNSSGYDTYSDVGSSMETFTRRRLARKFGAAGRSMLTEEEDESSDSAASSELSTMQGGGINDRVPPVANDSGGPKKASIEKISSDDDNDVPSAPPFSGQTEDFRQEATSTPPSEVKPEDNRENEKASQLSRPTVACNTSGPSSQHPARLPAFHASALGPWHAVVSYDACVRVCLHAWAKGCMEAPPFLENECALLRDAFGLQQVLLQSEEELLVKRSAEVASEEVAPKPKKTIGKMKVQVRRIKTALDAPGLRAIKLTKIRIQLSKFQTRFASGLRALRKGHVASRAAPNGSLPRQSLGYVHASTKYINQVSGLLKTGVTSMRNSSASYDIAQEAYSCMLRLKSATDDDTIRMQPGSGESHIFFPDGLGDDLIIEVLDSKGKQFGRVLVQLATISEDSGDKLRWWSIFREPEHQLAGKLQLCVNYSAGFDDNSHLKCGSVAETVAYDLALEVAMKMERFQQRNLLLHGSWKWLLAEFSSYYGVSDVYTKLRYLSYVMDVATPTSDCLNLVYNLLMPVIMKGHSKSALSHQENRMLGEIKDQIEQTLALVFENYKSLDESSFSGIMEVFQPAKGVAAPAVTPAVKLYTLLHDILSPEAQTNFCHYFQSASKKRSRRYLSETDEFVTNNNEPNFLDPTAISSAYQKMTMVCKNVKNEIFTDIEIHNQNILPSFLDLPNLSASIYSSDLCARLRAFLLAFPPSGPSSTVAELVIATADFQRDLGSWNISPVKGGVDAKELFHLYIMLWIQDKRLSLLESCKLDKVKWSGVKTRYSTTPFVDEMYSRLTEMIHDYQVIISRWPEYIFVLESAIADVEKAIVEALDKQYADVLSPLRENLAPKKLSLKYVQMLTKRSVCAYIVPAELGILLNSMKRMLDVLRPNIESKFRAWASCIPEGGNTAPGERLSEVTVMLRAKFRNYIQAMVEKLADNSKLQKTTTLKKILQDSKERVGESEIRGNMQALKEQLTSAINHLHTVCEAHVFIALCRGYWDRMGQIVLSFLENRKENRAWYKGSRIAVSILDDTFASQMQQLLGNSLKEQDLEPPRSIMDVRSILCKDAVNQKDKSFYY